MIVMLGCELCRFYADVMEAVFVEVQFGQRNKIQNHLL